MNSRGSLLPPPDGRRGPAAELGGADLRRLPEAAGVLPRRGDDLHQRRRPGPRSPRGRRCRRRAQVQDTLRATFVLTPS